jgi:hypothetical protein
MQKRIFLIRVFSLAVIAGASFLAGCVIISRGEDHLNRRVNCTWTTPIDARECGVFARERDCFDYSRTFNKCLGYHCTTCE